MAGSKFYIELLVHLTDLGQSIELLTSKSYKHVRNNHKALRFNQIKEFQEVNKKLQDVLKALEGVIKNSQFHSLDVIESDLNDLSKFIGDLIETQVSLTKTEESSPKNTTLYFSLMLETRDLIQASLKLSELYKNSL